MEKDLPNLRCMAKRHTTPGAIAIYLLFLILFLPKVWDTAWGEPWISNELMLTRTSQGGYLVEDTVATRSLVYGDRQLTIEAPDGTVICSSRWSGAWTATSKRNWRLGALMGNCEPPSGVFRICSRFSLFSQSGRHRVFEPFCSPETSVEPQSVKKG